MDKFEISDGRVQLIAFPFNERISILRIDIFDDVDQSTIWLSPNEINSLISYLVKQMQAIGEEITAIKINQQS